jgi:hypothetical protein
MSFDAFAARDFPEHLRSLSILQLSRLTNGFADFAPESASVRRFEGTHHKNITVREQDRPRYPLRPQRVDARKCLPLGPAARAQHSCNRQCRCTVLAGAMDLLCVSHKTIALSRFGVLVEGTNNVVTNPVTGTAKVLSPDQTLMQVSLLQFSCLPGYIIRNRAKQGWGPVGIFSIGLNPDELLQLTSGS